MSTIAAAAAAAAAAVTNATRMVFLNTMNYNSQSQPSLTTQNCYYKPLRSPFLSSPKPLGKQKSASLLQVPSYTFLSVGNGNGNGRLSLKAALAQDIGATAFVLAGGYALVSAFDFLTFRNIISQKLSRKLVHIFSGLLFVASWPLFSTSTEARYFASIAPLANSIRLVVYGFSFATDEGLIKSVTREGKPEELLRGPLYYVLTLALCAVVFWRESPVGLLSLAMMCGGDGIADIVGRRFGYAKLPYNQTKSWAGSISMFAFGFLVSIGMLYYYSALGYFQMDWNFTTKRVAVVSFIATIVESLPTTELIDDNISVPLVTLLAAYICFTL